MKRYIEYEEFYDMLDALGPNEKAKVYTEYSEGTNESLFQKILFNNEDIILYASPLGVGVIQSACGMFDWDDLVEAAWDSIITENEECKVYVL